MKYESLESLESFEVREALRREFEKWQILTPIKKKSRKVRLSILGIEFVLVKAVSGKGRNKSFSFRMETPSGMLIFDRPTLLDLLYWVRGLFWKYLIGVLIDKEHSINRQLVAAFDELIKNNLDNDKRILTRPDARPINGVKKRNKARNKGTSKVDEHIGTGRDTVCAD